MRFFDSEKILSPIQKNKAANRRDILSTSNLKNEKSLLNEEKPFKCTNFNRNVHCDEENSKVKTIPPYVLGNLLDVSKASNRSHSVRNSSHNRQDMSKSNLSHLNGYSFCSFKSKSPSVSRRSSKKHDRYSMVQLMRSSALNESVQFGSRLARSNIDSEKINTSFSDINVSCNSNNLQNSNIRNVEFKSDSNGFVDNEYNYWATVFGFPENLIEKLIDKFSIKINIDRYEFDSDIRWLHVRVKTLRDMEILKSMNGILFENSAVIGVTDCKKKFSSSKAQFKSCDKEKIITFRNLSTNMNNTQSIQQHKIAEKYNYQGPMRNMETKEPKTNQSQVIFKLECDPSSKKSEISYLILDEL
ncbi:hypothetical protein A3Q56_04196 [Intoshia linei]|uniref:Nucleoporin NUP35 n=1 Tax=Intoshia linei TaxID=1819745 RepID=A0A177B379_9BILA|nr:hypothetical protein A3Q56_04196 [Intoshia linei]